MKKIVLASLATVALSGCATVPPGVAAMSAIEKGARAAEVACTANASTGKQLVINGTLDKDKFKDAEFKYYAGLQIIRLAFASIEPQSAQKLDYVALQQNCDAAHSDTASF